MINIENLDILSKIQTYNTLIQQDATPNSKTRHLNFFIQQNSKQSDLIKKLSQQLQQEKIKNLFQRSSPGTQLQHFKNIFTSPLSGILNQDDQSFIMKLSNKQKQSHIIACIDNWQFSMRKIESIQQFTYELLNNTYKQKILFDNQQQQLPQQNTLFFTGTPYVPYFQHPILQQNTEFKHIESLNFCTLFKQQIEQQYIQESNYIIYNKQKAKFFAHACQNHIYQKEKQQKLQKQQQQNYLAQISQQQYQQQTKKEILIIKQYFQQIVKYFNEIVKNEQINVQYSSQQLQLFNKELLKQQTEVVQIINLQISNFTGKNQQCYQQLIKLKILQHEILNNDKHTQQSQQHNQNQLLGEIFSNLKQNQHSLLNNKIQEDYLKICQLLQQLNQNSTTQNSVISSLEQCKLKYILPEENLLFKCSLIYSLLALQYEFKYVLLNLPVNSLRTVQQLTQYFTLFRYLQQQKSQSNIIIYTQNEQLQQLQTLMHQIAQQSCYYIQTIDKSLNKTISSNKKGLDLKHENYYYDSTNEQIKFNFQGIAQTQNNFDQLISFDKQLNILIISYEALQKNQTDVERQIKRFCDENQILQQFDLGFLHYPDKVGYFQSINAQFKVIINQELETNFYQLNNYKLLFNVLQLNQLKYSHLFKYFNQLLGIYNQLNQQNNSQQQCLQQIQQYINQQMNQIAQLGQQLMEIYKYQPNKHIIKNSLPQPKLSEVVVTQKFNYKQYVLQEMSNIYNQLQLFQRVNTQQESNSKNKIRSDSFLFTENHYITQAQIQQSYSNIIQFIVENYANYNSSCQNQLQQQTQEQYLAECLKQNPISYALECLIEYLNRVCQNYITQQISFQRLFTIIQNQNIMSKHQGNQIMNQLFRNQALNGTNINKTCNLFQLKHIYNQKNHEDITYIDFCLSDYYIIKFSYVRNVRNYQSKLFGPKQFSEKYYNKIQQYNFLNNCEYVNRSFLNYIKIEDYISQQKNDTILPDQEYQQQYYYPTITLQKQKNFGAFSKRIQLVLNINKHDKQQKLWLTTQKNTLYDNNSNKIKMLLIKYQTFRELQDSYMYINQFKNLDQTQNCQHKLIDIQKHLYSAINQSEKNDTLNQSYTANSTNVNDSINEDSVQNTESMMYTINIQSNIQTVIPQENNNKIQKKIRNLQFDPQYNEYLEEIFSLLDFNWINTQKFTNQIFNNIIKSQLITFKFMNFFNMQVNPDVRQSYKLNQFVQQQMQLHNVKQKSNGNQTIVNIYNKDSNSIKYWGNQLFLNQLIQQNNLYQFYNSTYRRHIFVDINKVFCYSSLFNSKLILKLNEIIHCNLFNLNKERSSILIIVNSELEKQVIQTMMKMIFTNKSCYSINSSLTKQHQSPKQLYFYSNDPLNFQQNYQNQKEIYISNGINTFKLSEYNYSTIILFPSVNQQNTIDQLKQTPCSCQQTIYQLSMQFDDVKITKTINQQKQLHHQIKNTQQSISLFSDLLITVIQQVLNVTQLHKLKKIARKYQNINQQLIQLCQQYNTQNEQNQLQNIGQNIYQLNYLKQLLYNTSFTNTSQYNVLLHLINTIYQSQYTLYKPIQPFQCISFNQCKQLINQQQLIQLSSNQFKFPTTQQHNQFLTLYQNLEQLQQTVQQATSHQTSIIQKQNVQIHSTSNITNKYNLIDQNYAITTYMQQKYQIYQQFRAKINIISYYTYGDLQSHYTNQYQQQNNSRKDDVRYYINIPLMIAQNPFQRYFVPKCCLYAISIQSLLYTIQESSKVTPEQFKLKLSGFQIRDLEQINYFFVHFQLYKDILQVKIHPDIKAVMFMAQVFRKTNTGAAQQNAINQITQKPMQQVSLVSQFTDGQASLNDPHKNILRFQLLKQIEQKDNLYNKLKAKHQNKLKKIIYPFQVAIYNKFDQNIDINYELQMEYMDFFNNYQRELNTQQQNYQQFAEKLKECFIDNFVSNTDQEIQKQYLIDNYKEEYESLTTEIASCGTSPLFAVYFAVRMLKSVASIQFVNSRIDDINSASVLSFKNNENLFSNAISLGLRNYDRLNNNEMLELPELQFEKLDFSYFDE